MGLNLPQEDALLEARGLSENDLKFLFNFYKKTINDLETTSNELNEKSLRIIFMQMI